MAERQSVSTSEVDANGVRTFTFTDGRTVSIDPKSLPQASLVQLVDAGITTLMQRSYLGATSIDDAFTRAAERAQKLAAGNLTFGVRGPREAKDPDEIVLALCELLGKDRQFVEETWLPRYLTSHTTVDAGGRTRGAKAAKEALRSHKQLAPILAKMAQDRAKQARGRDDEDLGQFVADEPEGSPEAAAAE